MPRPLCPPHLITSQYYFCNDSSCKNWLRLPVPCNCALKLYIISWLYQNLSNLVLNVLVVLADTTQFGKLFHVFTTVLVIPNFRRLYFTWEVETSQVSDHYLGLQIHFLYAKWVQHMADISQWLSCKFLSYPLLYVYNVGLATCTFSVFHSKADFLCWHNFGCSFLHLFQGFNISFPMWCPNRWTVIEVRPNHAII